MLFKVRWNENNHIYKVYCIKSTKEMCGESEFLIYENHSHRWIWICANDCEPI